MGSISVSKFGSVIPDTVAYGQAHVTVGQIIGSAKLLSVANSVAAEYKRRTKLTFTVSSSFASLDTKVVQSNLNTLKSRLEATPVTPANSPSGHASYTRIPTPDNQAGNGGTDNGQLPETVNFVAATAYTTGFQGIDTDGIIYAQNINDLIDKLQGAGNICICNCNYCTCNCNYCTCNCNYACTCNCNYSDERLKCEINYV
jgi:hypothetical protein